MRPFWRRRRTHLVETLLRAYRPEPDSEFVASILEQITPERRPVAILRPRLGGRLALAGALSVLALVAATAAFGGVGQASHGVQGFVSTSAHTFGIGHSGPSSDGGKTQNGGSFNPNGGTTGGKTGDGGEHHCKDGWCHEYWVHVCHWDPVHHRYVEITVDRKDLWKWLDAHPKDYITPPGGCCSKGGDH